MGQSYSAPKWASYMVEDSAYRYLSSLEPGRIIYNYSPDGLPELNHEELLNRPEETPEE